MAQATLLNTVLLITDKPGHNYQKQADYILDYFRFNLQNVQNIEEERDNIPVATAISSYNHIPILPSFRHTQKFDGYFNFNEIYTDDYPNDAQPISFEPKLGQFDLILAYKLNNLYEFYLITGFGQSIDILLKQIMDIYARLNDGGKIVFTIRTKKFSIVTATVEQLLTEFDRPRNLRREDYEERKNTFINAWNDFFQLKTGRYRRDYFDYYEKKDINSIPRGGKRKSRRHKRTKKQKNKSRKN